MLNDQIVNDQMVNKNASLSGGILLNQGKSSRYDFVDPNSVCGLLSP